jgi:NAD+ synthase
MFNASNAIGQICDWMEQQVRDANAKGIVLGLSGGIDSAVVAYLGKKIFGDNVIGIIMPCHSLPQDKDDALLVAEAGGIATKTVVLDAIYDSLLATAGDVGGDESAVSMSQANIKPRLRMTTLYYFAQCHNMLVAGTGNLSEKTIGYFTKHGDSGVDILPIADLVKSEVRKVAEILDVPRQIIDKPPSAGLWQGQTDEDEIGISYADLDAYIRTGSAPASVVALIEKYIHGSAHKLQLPPYCELRKD